MTEWANRQFAGQRTSYRNEAPRVIWLAFAKMLKRRAARITRADTVNVLDGLVKDSKAAMAARTLVCACAALLGPTSEARRRTILFRASRSYALHNPATGFLTTPRLPTHLDEEGARFWLLKGKVGVGCREARRPRSRDRWKGRAAGAVGTA